MIGRGIGIPFRHGTGGGTSIPPEIKKNIIAWYDPKKQGMTNYDVIESYAEDFTASKWVTVQDRAVFTKTASKIHITESMSNGFNTSFIETSQSRYGNEMKINVSGIVAGGVTLKYRYGSYEEVVDITSNGVYTLPAGKAGTNPNGYNGFVMKAKGKCDITITQLPTSILKDFSGNKHDAYLYGFKGRLNSGVGVYVQDFTKWIFGSIINNISTKHHNKIHIVKKNPNAYFGYTVGIQKANYYNKPYKLKFNFNKKIDDIKFTIVSTDGNLISTRCFSAIINSGSVVDIPIISEEIFNNQKEPTIYYDFGTNKDIEIDVELIPDYPNQLCYDGKSYAVAYDMPILTDYTVMAERTWFENRNIFLAKGNITTEAKYAFIFERFKPDGVMAVQSFGAWNDVVSTTDSCISYLTKNKYNGIDIRSGIGADDDMLSIGGALNKGNIELTSVCCHGAIIVADRSFTEEEINWLKQNWDKI